MNAFFDLNAPREDKSKKMVIYITGLNDSRGQTVIENKEFIQNTLNSLLKQIPKAMSVQIINFDKEWDEKTKEEITKIIPKDARVESISYQDDYLTKEMIRSDTYLVLNFAGTEITDDKLLNDNHFIETSLYYSPQQQKQFISYLSLNENQEMQNFCFVSSDNVKAVNRTEYSIARDGPDIISTRKASPLPH